MIADKEGATERHRGRNQRHASSGTCSIVFLSPIKSCYGCGRVSANVQYFRGTYPLTSIQSSVLQVSNDKERKNARMWLIPGP